MNGINPFTTMDERTATWGAKEWMAQRVDNLGAKINAYNNRTQGTLFRTPSNLEQLFKLERTKSPQLGDVFKPQQYTKRVSKNFSNLKDAIEFKTFSKGQNAGKIIKGVLIDDNVKPIRSLLKGDFNYLGSGLIRLLGLGFMGFDTMKQTRVSYQTDGSSEAIQTFIKTGFKHLLTWQAAGLGFMFGRALLPNIGKLPLGGILTGVVAAISTGAALDKVLKSKAEVNTPYSILEPQTQSPSIDYLG